MADFSMFSPDGVNMLNVKDAPARNMVTDAFSPSTAYAVGDYCIYDGVLYICTTAHEGAWTAGDFTATTIANELKNAGGDMSSYQTKNLETPLTINGSSQTTVESALGALNTVGVVKNDLTTINQTGTIASQTISAGTFFYLNGVLVKAETDILNGATFTLGTNYTIVSEGALNTFGFYAYSTSESTYENNYIKMFNGTLIQWGYVIFSTDQTRLVHGLSHSYIDVNYSLFLYLEDHGYKDTASGYINDKHYIMFIRNYGSSTHTNPQKCYYLTIGKWK